MKNFIGKNPVLMCLVVGALIGLSGKRLSQWIPQPGGKVIQHVSSFAGLAIAVLLPLRLLKTDQKPE